MVKHTMDNIKMVKCTDMANCINKMVLYMKDILKITLHINMVEIFLQETQMNQTPELNAMKDKLMRMEKLMVKVLE